MNAARARRTVDRFDGEIAGLGSASGTRVVLGLWTSTPFGAVADAMVETADGHRVLIAPSAEVAAYIAATYRFDEIRVEATSLLRTPTGRRFSSASLAVTVRLGHRTAVGRLLRLVPGPLARSRWWCRAVDPVARLARDGVRTVGTAGGGRREYYSALDEHSLRRVDGTWEARALGDLRPVTPPVRFGFGSTPPEPSIVRITTSIELPAG